MSIVIFEHVIAGWEVASYQVNFHLTVIFDNLFTSLALLNHFPENEIVGTGTLRTNRTDHCPIKDLEVIGKEDRGD